MVVVAEPFLAENLVVRLNVLLLKVEETLLHSHLLLLLLLRVVSSMTGTTKMVDSDGDGDGIPDSSDKCADNSNPRCYKEEEGAR